MAKIDHRSFGPNGPTTITSVDFKWWKLPDSEIPQSIASIIAFMNVTQGERIRQLNENLAMYGNLSVMGLNGITGNGARAYNKPVRDRLTLNVVQAAVDTVTSKIAKNKPDPLFLTTGGSRLQQKKAQNLDKFVDGIFYENDSYNEGQKVFKDGAVLGSGFSHIFADGKRAVEERVLAHELYVDEVEAAYGYPRQIHRVKDVDRDVLAEKYPKSAKAISMVNPAGPQTTGNTRHISDVVTVRESHRLPSGPDAGDGLHVITIDNAVLMKEEWTKPYFPYAELPWNKRIVGFWGQGLPEILAPIQLEINKICFILQRSYHLAGSFKILISNGSKIVKEHLNNDVGAIITYAGNLAPQYITPPIVPAEMYQHLENLVNKAMFESGVSALSAGGMKPAGLNSGRALREYNDIESDRFMIVGQNLERYYLTKAKLYINTTKEIFEETKKYKVFVPFKKAAINIDWRDVDLEEDEYVMQVYPVSSLPKDPEGRLETVQEYVQAGMMAPRTGRRLLDFPDLAQEEGLENSPEEYLAKIIEKILDDEDIETAFTAPEPYDDLDLALQMGLEYYAYAKQNDVEEPRLDLIRKFIDYVKALQLKASQPPQGAPQQGALPPGAGAPPQANPEPTPTSGLVPNGAVQ